MLSFMTLVSLFSCYFVQVIHKLDGLHQLLALILPYLVQRCIVSLHIVVCRHQIYLHVFPHKIFQSLLLHVHNLAQYRVHFVFLSLLLTIRLALALDWLLWLTVKRQVCSQAPLILTMWIIANCQCVFNKFWFHLKKLEFSERGIVLDELLPSFFIGLRFELSDL